jgi:hypothetical protein
MARDESPMAQLRYLHYPAITINDQQPFHSRVLGLLEIIRSLSQGQRLLGEIQASTKEVGIAPQGRAD